MQNIQQAVTISIRAKTQQRTLIDQAAERLGRTRSDFMIEAACRQAQMVMLDQTYFVLDSKKFKNFTNLLDKTTEPSERLKRTMSVKPPWVKTNKKTR